MSGSSLPPLPPRPQALTPNVGGSSPGSAVKDTVTRVLLAALAAIIALVIVELTIGMAVDDRLTAEIPRAVPDWYRNAYGGIVLAAVGACLLGYIAAAGGSSTRGLIEAAKGAAVGLIVGFTVTFLTDPLIDLEPIWLRNMLTSAILGGLFGLGLGIAQMSVKQSILSALAGLFGGACARGVVDALDLDLDRFPTWAISYLAISIFVAAFIAAAQVIARDTWMTVVDGPLTGKQFIVSNAVTTIGRNYQCDLVFAKDPMIADQHLRIDRDKNGAHVLYVAPGASAAVNGQLAGSALLRHGDIVTIGSTSLRFEIRNAG